MSDIRRRLIGAALAATVFVADQASKVWAIGLLDAPERPVIPVTPFLSLTMSWNRGIAYTLLRSDSDFGRFALAGLALAMVGLLGFWAWRSTDWLKTCGLLDFVHEQVVFTDTRAAKLEAVRALGCNLLIDDLPEVFHDPAYPLGTDFMLFDPDYAHTDWTPTPRASSWAEVRLRIFP